MIHYRHQGSGPPLVLLHGLFGSLENLSGIAAALSGDFSVYSCDLPNHGRSCHTDNICLASMTQSLAHWPDQEGLERVSLLGHSLGGKVAMEFALRYPVRAERLVVLDIAPVTYPARHNDVFAGLLSLDLSSLGSRRDADVQLAQHLSDKGLRGFLLKNLYKDKQGLLQWRMNLDVIYRDYPKLVYANIGNTRYDGEVLFVKGEDSDYITEQHRDQILSRFPKAQIKRVQGAGHWLHAEKPQVFARLVQRFLSEPS